MLRLRRILKLPRRKDTLNGSHTLFAQCCFLCLAGYQLLEIENGVDFPGFTLEISSGKPAISWLRCRVSWITLLRSLL